jgi:two-component system response regulator PilR (NtrC family)
VDLRSSAPWWPRRWAAPAPVRRTRRPRPARERGAECRRGARPAARPRPAAPPRCGAWSARRHHAAGALADREGGAQHGAGAGAGRVGHRQGTGRARHPRGVAARRPGLRGGELRRHPRALLEAEFFGYRKGAFTGANEDREGFFQAANGGTLFLDEIGELPLSMQSKLLRVIQERAVRPLGSTAELPVNVRIVSATHKDLAPRWQASRFRQDLYYRLNVIQIAVPPLRDRLEDLVDICARCSPASPPMPAWRRCPN